MSVIMRGSVTKKKFIYMLLCKHLATPQFKSILELSEVLKAKADNNQVEKYLAPT